MAKLLSLMLKGVRINIDVPAVTIRHQNRANKVLDFRNTKIPSFIITVVQVWKNHLSTSVRFCGF